MKFLKLLFINLSILFILILVVELIFGSWLYKNKNYKSLLIPRQQSDLLDNLPYETDKVGIFTRDKNGFRSNSYNFEDINILIIGGSTTEERDVDDNLIWTKIFENNINMNFKVLNAGIGGQTSYGHSKIYKLWLSKFEDLKPNYLLFYLGINDALKLIEDSTNLNNNQTGRILNNSNRDLLINVKIFDRSIQYIKNNSILHSLYKILKGNLIARKYNISYNKSPQSFDPFVTSSPENLEKLDRNNILDYKEYYFNNLNEILYLKKIYNSEIILITQVISDNHWLFPYLNKLNKFTADFCKKNKLKCILLHKYQKKFDNKYFYDGIHTNPDGSKLVGELIARDFHKLIN